jgi:carbon monoxide dehydrogenase subunit G
MQIEGERRFEAPPEAVYGALTDPGQMAEAFSSIDRIDVEGDDWTVIVRPPLPGGFRLRFSVRFQELREPEHARFEAWGKTLGGRISVDSAFDLEPDADGTLMRWSAVIDAAGILSGLGSQALAPAATRQAERALERLAGRLPARAR